VGDRIYFDVIRDYPPDILCLAVVTGWSLVEDVGPLPAGFYTVYVTLFEGSIPVTAPTAMAILPVIEYGGGLDCNQNGTRDECDIAIQTSLDCNGDGVPDECETEAGCEVAKLTAADTAGGDIFGYAVAISGDITVVGARYDDDCGTDSGSAYVIQRDGSNWVQLAKLSASDCAAGDSFGDSVSIDGDTVIVGARWDDDGGEDSGSAYVFEKPPAGWVDMTETAKLIASDGAEGDWFGHPVSISSDTVVIGAHHDDDDVAGHDSGSVYVFVEPVAGWDSVFSPITEDAKLTASDAAAVDQFGVSVSVSGGTVVIGANGDDDVPDASGAAYVFQIGPNGIWDSGSVDQVAKFTASDIRPLHQFGRDVSISGDTLVIGAKYDDDGGYRAGAAYVFETGPNGVWDGGSVDQVAKLTASDAAANDWFGASVSISGDTIVVGARQDDDACSGDPDSDSGSVYVFEKPAGGWATMTETDKLTASDAERGDFFGCSASISGDTVIIGAWRDDDACPGDPDCDSGSAYVFALAGPDCDCNGVIDACDIADGTLADCNNNGIPDECDIADGTSPDDNGNGIPDECEVRLIQICDNLGENLGLGCSRQCISPKSRHVPFDEVDVLILAVAPFTLEACSCTSTGGTLPADCDIEVIDAFLGEYRIVFKDGADQRVGIPVGEWTSVALTVQVADVSLTRDLRFEVGHLPGDCNMDAQVSLSDATSFGTWFANGGPLELGDLNGDGQINLNDATKFGQIWNGTDGEGVNPDGTAGWRGEGLPPRPTCDCP